MHDGVLQQVGTPTEVYHTPANLFVAQFIGSPVMNVTSATLSVEDDRTMVALKEGSGTFAFPGDLHHRISATSYSSKDILVGVRPESVLVERQETPGYVPVEAHIIEPLGAYDIVDLKIGGHFLRARTGSGYVKAGSTVWAKLDEANTHFFNADTEQALPLERKQHHG